jgi:catechol 2,3-dioxygenase-like lactoylglutathione lyase family enzyme
MFDHIGIGASDLERSKAFFRAALEPLGIGIASDGSDSIGVGPPGKPALWIGATRAKLMPIHIAFTATTRKQVDDFYARALAAGAKDNGPPGLRADYSPTYYAAFVIGPDGHNVEAVCHRAE